MKICFLLGLLLCSILNLNAQVTKTVECTAGNLSSLLTIDEQHIITDLTVTGTMNALDFKTIRENMYSLLALNISAVTINECIDPGYESPPNQLPQNAFYNYYTLKINSILLPDNITSVGNSAFSGCRKMTSIIIPSTVDSIGASAFKDCIGLTTINLSPLMTSIENNTFTNCSELLTITLPESISIIRSNAFSRCTKLTTIDLPKVKRIENNAFEYCNALSTVTLPSVTSIGDNAFHACSGLNEIILPTSLVHLGEGAFQFCGNLKAIVIPGSLTNLPNKVFDGCGLTTLNIPNSINSIGSYAFSNCKSLVSIDIPSSVTAISSNTFAGCNNLVNVALPSTLKLIGNQAFSFCNSIIDISIPSHVESIEDNAFNNCSGLYSIIIPPSVSYIGTSVFAYCSGLISVTLPHDLTSIPDNMFYRCIRLDSIVIPSTVTSIGNGAFDFCRTLSSITIPPSVTKIGNKAFEGCDSITAINIPTSVNYIGNWAFLGSGLKSITIPTSIKEIKSGTFATTPLTSISIPSSVIAVGDSAFMACNQLTSVTFPSSVISIGKYAFYNCNYLESVIFQGLLTSIPDNIFEECDRLASVAIPNSVRTIGYRSFYRCQHLTSINLPSSLTSLGNYCFGQCNQLASISIPSAVTSIGGNAFEHCKKMLTVYSDRKVPVNLNSPYTFYNADINNKTLYVPYGSKSAYQTDKEWKNFGTIIEIPGFYLTSKIDTITADGGVLSTDIIANVAWTAISDQSWLTVSPENGSGNKKLTMTALGNKSNSDRTAIVTVTSAGVDSETFEVYQQGRKSDIFLSLSTNNIILQAVENSSATILVSSNSSWNAVSDQSWLQVDPNDETRGNRLLTLTSAENPTSSSRSAKITVSGIGFPPKTIFVTQRSFSEAPFINSSVSTIKFKAKDDIPQKVNIHSFIKWNASSNQSWLAVSPTSTIEGDSVLIISATENTDGFSRYGTISVVGESIRRTISVSQEGAPTITLSKSDIFLDHTAGSKDSVEYTTNTSISINSDQSWLTASISGGNKIILTAAENPTFVTRTCKVTVDKYTDYQKTIYVTQKGIEISKTVEITAGNLSRSLTNDEKSTITNLKISGTIDARDFKTMRDSMPALEYIDLLSSRIDSYTGPLGTVSNNLTYPENVCPTYAFAHKSNIKSITLPSSIVKVDVRAFYSCTSLNEVVLPDIITVIEDQAFYCCLLLKYINMPASLQRIGDFSFSKTSICNLNLPISLISVGNYCFQYCNLLSAVVINSSMKDWEISIFSHCENLESVDFAGSPYILPESIFEYCLSLKSVTIPESVYKIDVGAFIGCRSLKSIAIPTSVRIIDSYAFGSCSKLQNIVVPHTVTNLGSYVFKDCSELKSVVLSPSITSISYALFENCAQLSSVNIPVSETFPLQIYSIGARAFSGCSNLNSYNIPPMVETIGESAFASSGLTSIVIPPSVKNIERYAFQNCIELRSIELSPNLSAIHNSTFVRCYGLKSITIPSSVKTIDAMAFYNCDNLAKVVISEGVLAIRSGAFSRCNNLKYISIPSSIAKIEYDGFEDATILSDVYVYSKIPLDLSITGIVFENSNTDNAILHVPVGTKNAYQQAFLWKEFKNIVEMPFMLSTDNVTINGTTGGTATVGVTSNTNWEISCDQKWLTITPLGTTSGNALISITAGINPNSSKRAAEVLIISTESDTIKIKVSQSEGLAALSLSKQMVNLRSESFNYDLVDVKTNAAWYVSQDQSWLDVLQNTKSGDGTITIMALTNSTNMTRSATITVTASGLGTQQITVSQEPSPIISYDLSVSNTSINTTQNKCFNALESITVAGDGTTVAFQSGSTVELIAGQSIQFLPGFHAQSGSYMNAHITTDGSFCDGALNSLVQQAVKKSLQLDEINEVQELNDDILVKVYPNPNNGQFKVAISGAAEECFEIEVFNMQGKKVYSSSRVSMATSEISINNAYKGIYILKVTTGGNTYSGKIILQ